MSKPTVLLEGDSLFMDSIAALLQSDAELEVRQIGKASDRLPPQEINPPAIVLFDLDRIETGLLLNYLTGKPGTVADRPQPDRKHSGLAFPGVANRRHQ